MSEPRESEKSNGAVREATPASADAQRGQHAPKLEFDAWLPGERPADRSLVGQSVGSYRVLRLLGEGGVGAVYLGEHPVVHSRVAIKVLHDDHARSTEMVHRFVTEARAANSIPSPHVVRVSDFGRLDDGREYAVMEYLEGRSLGEILQLEHALEPRRAIELLRQTAEGMAVAHEHGIIHRDLKPENLFVQSDPDNGEFVRILDFGIAKLTSGFARDARLTASGVFVGTPLYCSPEQMANRDVGPASDIYSLGAVAFEMVTGKPVFDGDCADVLAQKARGASAGMRELNGGVPPALAELIREMLAVRPGLRPGSMGEVARRLAAIAEELELRGSGGAQQVTVRGQQAGERKRKWWGMGVAAVGVVVVAGVVLWAWGGGGGGGVEAGKGKGMGMGTGTSESESESESESAKTGASASTASAVSRANTGGSESTGASANTGANAGAGESTGGSAKMELGSIEGVGGETSGKREDGVAEERGGVERGKGSVGGGKDGRRKGRVKKRAAGELGTLVDPFAD